MGAVRKPRVGVPAIPSIPGGHRELHTPTSSPAFNYAFKREDDTIKFGVNIYLSRMSRRPKIDNSSTVGKVSA